MAIFITTCKHTHVVSGDTKVERHHFYLNILVLPIRGIKFAKIPHLSA